MMSKMQKTCLWIFGAMFLVPESIFLILPSSIVNYFLGRDLLNIYSLFFDSHFFINNWFYFPKVLGIEFIGLLGLLIISIKSKKKELTILLAFTFLCFLF